MTDTRITEIPEELRTGLPDELRDADIVGTDTASADESLRLHGPPGTGKSTQCALRIGALTVDGPQLRPGQVSVVTYRRSLADTIRKRLVEWGAVEVPDGVDPNSSKSENPFRYWTTIHAAATRATGFHRELDSEDPFSGMASARSKVRFCKEHGIRYKPSKPWLETRWTVFEDLYQYAKNNLLDVGEWDVVSEDRLTPLRSDNGAEQRLEEFRDEWGSTSFRTVVKRWEDFKDNHDVYDFYQQLEAALAGGKPPTRLLVVDEYHDATPLMAAVTELWIDTADTVIVAGDPDQVVNSYAGASPKFFEELDDRVGKELPVVRLDRSWRCPDEHFEAAARVLRKERQPPALETDGPGEIIRHDTGRYMHDGDRWKLPDADASGSAYQLWENYGPGVMFLTRTQKQADGIAAALDENGVVYRSQNSVGGSWEMRLSLLRALDALEGVIPKGQARHGTLSGGEAEHRNPDNLTLRVEDAKTLFRRTHDRYFDSDEDERREWLADYDYSGEEFIPLTEFTQYVTKDWWPAFNRGSRSVERFTGLSDRDKEAMRKAWNRYEDFKLELDEVGTRILTIHASKGAEATDVVVFDGITGRIGDALSDQGARENEARTWYVALTRASERLHVVRDAFEWTEEYLPDDLEPQTARAAADSAALTDGGDGK
jgi:DNA helicase-2/ATP-dependent DNA helicase PcrA